MFFLRHTSFLVVFWVCLSQITIEAEADAKANPNHHSASSSKSSIIANAVKPKGQMGAKGAKAQAATRRSDIDSHGKNGFTSRSIRTNFGDQQPVSRTFRQTSNSQNSYSPAPTFSEPPPSSYGVPQSAPVYKPVENEKKVIIKVLPLPIPVGTPVPAPVHVGVPAVPPFVNSQYGAYQSLPLKGFGVVPRIDKGESDEPVAQRRSADPDHGINGIIGGQFGHSDSHIHTTHHHTQSSHEIPQVIVANPQQYGYPTISLPSITHPQYVLVPRPETTPYANGLFGGFGGPLTPTLTNVALGNTAHSLHSAFGLGSTGLQHGGYGAYPYLSQGGYQGGIPNALGNDPIKASFIAARSNPLIHLLAAPYIKNIKENNGEDLPTLDDLQDLLERSSFGLSGFEDGGKK